MNYMAALQAFWQSQWEILASAVTAFEESTGASSEQSDTPPKEETLDPAFWSSLISVIIYIEILLILLGWLVRVCRKVVEVAFVACVAVVLVLAVVSYDETTAAKAALFVKAVGECVSTFFSDLLYLIQK